MGENQFGVLSGKIRAIAKGSVPFSDPQTKWVGFALSMTWAAVRIRFGAMRTPDPTVRPLPVASLGGSIRRAAGVRRR